MINSIFDDKSYVIDLCYWKKLIKLFSAHVLENSYFCPRSALKKCVIWNLDIRYMEP